MATVDSTKRMESGRDRAAELELTSPRSSISTRASVDEDTPFLAEVRSNDSTPTARDASEAEESDEWSHLPPWRRPSIWWLIAPFCLFTTAFGSIAVPRLNIILSLICRQYFADQGLDPGIHILGNDNRKCQTPEVQALVSKFILVMGLISGVLGAISSPRLGQLSDRYGRRLFISLSSLGLLSSEICTVLAALYPDIISVNIILVGSVLDGVSGSFLLGQAVASSYAADCTPAPKRAVAFGYFAGCLYLGIAIGPALGSLIIKATGNILNVFYFAIAMCIAFIAYTFLILPESLGKERMQEARDKHTAKVLERQNETTMGRIRRHANILEPLRTAVPSGPVKLKRNMLLLAAIDTVLFGVGMGSMTIILLYAELSFGWESVQTGFFMSIVNSTRVTMLFLILPLIARWFRKRPSQQTPKHGADDFDIFLIRFSVISELIGYASYAVARSGTQFTAAGMMVSLGGAGSPTIQSTLTKHVPAENTGQVLGAIALLHSLARVLSPLIFNSIYAFVVVRNFSSGVFVCLASTFFIACVCCFGIKAGVGYSEEEDEVEEDEASSLEPTEGTIQAAS